MRYLSLIALSAALLGGCSPDGIGQPASGEKSSEMTSNSIYATEEGRDEHSYAKPLEARVEHVALDLDADFEARRMRGTATLDLVVADDATEVVLDSRDLEIDSITKADGTPLEWSLGNSDPAHGAPLTVQLDDADKIVIRYASAPDAPALQWLTPEQTAGGTQPFLFSQGQAILNRSWIPTQDSPGIRQTWEAWISVPDDLTVVMSGAKGEKADPTPANNGRRSFYFDMDKAVPPYLIAVGAGGLAFEEIGPRSGVYAEPSVVEGAASEFKDLERMIDAAESLYGPYRWGRYDLLVLPPSFPFGGMENPTLTFVTPTVLAGDRSLVSLIAHELAHSWSGNLVTNSNWNDFWLNEGFTVYFENRIMEKVYGKERADMLAALGYADLQEQIEALGGPEAADTQLHLDLAGRDPDDGMTDVAYEKGALFLRTIEKAVGRERLDTWLRGYFDRNAFQPQTSAGMLADMREHLFAGEEPPVDLDAWVYQPGIPEGAAVPTSDRFGRLDESIAAFTDGGSATDLDWGDWTTQERLYFLNGLPREMPAARLKALDDALSLSDSGNSEIRFAWLRLAIANRYDPAKPSAEEFLSSQGRRKFVEPLFEALMAEGAWGQPFARELYRRVRARYHSVTSSTIDRIVPLEER